MALEIAHPLSSGAAVDLIALNHLHEACATGLVPQALDLLDQGPSPMLVLPVMRHTPLTRAVQNGHLPLVQALMERMRAAGLDVDDEVHLVSVPPPGDESARTVEVIPRPLEVAIVHRQLPVLRHLLAEGADPDRPIGLNPDTLVRPLLHTVMRNQLQVMELLLEFHADPNLRSAFDHLPLKAAIMLGRPDMVTMLLLNGADPNLAPSPDGNAALHSLALNWKSASAGHVDTLKALVQHGADPWRQNAQGQSAWDLASDTALPWMVQAWTEQEKAQLIDAVAAEPAPLLASSSRPRL